MKASDKNLQRSSASGIFKYEDVYWGIHARPNDKRYTGSFRESKMNYPKHPFAEKDILSCIRCSFNRVMMRPVGSTMPMHCGISPFSIQSVNGFAVTAPSGKRP